MNGNNPKFILLTKFVDLLDIYYQICNNNFIFYVFVITQIRIVLQIKRISTFSHMASCIYISKLLLLLFYMTFFQCCHKHHHQNASKMGLTLPFVIIRYDAKDCQRDVIREMIWEKPAKNWIIKVFKCYQSCNTNLYWKEIWVWISITLFWTFLNKENFRKFKSLAQISILSKKLNFCCENYSRPEEICGD